MILVIFAIFEILTFILNKHKFASACCNHFQSIPHLTLVIYMHTLTHTNMLCVHVDKEVHGSTTRSTLLNDLNGTRLPSLSLWQHFYQHFLPARRRKDGRKGGREEGGGEPQDMKIKQDEEEEAEAAANRICLLAKKCNAFQFRPLNSFAYLRAAQQEQCAPSPHISARHPSAAPSLGTKFTQCKYAEPHARTHENTRTLAHTHTRTHRADIHTGSSHFLLPPYTHTTCPPRTARLHIV